jgi:hypothetical protein
VTQFDEPLEHAIALAVELLAQRRLTLPEERTAHAECFLSPVFGTTNSDVLGL